MNGRTNSSGTTINDLEIPLDPPSNLYLGPGNGIVELTWEDPKDKYATPEGEAMEDTDQLVSVWAYTRIVRKVGSAPTGPNDGTIVLESAVRDQYKETPFTDSGLTNGLNYYYGAYAYNTDGVPSEGNIQFVMVGYYAELNLNTWDQIAKASADGMASSIWSVGDTKTIHFEGELGRPNGSGNPDQFNIDLNVFITDFNHNPSREISGISFQGFKTLDGKDIALVLPSHYNSPQNTDCNFCHGTIDRPCLEWGNSYIRRYSLGSSDDPLSPEPLTVMNCLPLDLRQNLKLMRVYQCGNGSSTGIKNTSDYLILYSEFEYAGSITMGMSTEANYQTQYAYYANGNSPIKYRHDNNVASWHWTRSGDNSNPIASNNTGDFVVIRSDYESSGMQGSDGRYSYGLAPGFVI